MNSVYKSLQIFVLWKINRKEALALTPIGAYLRIEDARTAINHWQEKCEQGEYIGIEQKTISLELADGVHWPTDF